MMPAQLKPFHSAHQNPDDHAQNHQGVAIGYLGSDVPEELILAAGAFPLRLSGEKSGKTPFADEYIKQGFNPVARAVFEPILDGTYKFLDQIVFSNFDEFFVRLFYFTREIRRFDLNPNIPDFYFFEFLHGHSESSLRYNIDRVQEFRDILENWTSNRLQDTSLKHAISQCNENRELLGQVDNLRRENPPRLSGSHALQIFQATSRMPKTEHTDALHYFLGSANNFVPIENSVRVYLEGSSVDDLAFYEFVESCNATIVGENADWSNRAFDVLVESDGDPLEAIAKRYMAVPPHPSKATIQERVHYCLQQVEATQADAVIFVMYDGEHAPHWDYPEQHKALEARGIPTLCLPWQNYAMAQDESIRQDVAHFINSVADREGVAS